MNTRACFQPRGRFTAASPHSSYGKRRLGAWQYAANGAYRGEELLRESVKAYATLRINVLSHGLHRRQHDRQDKLFQRLQL